MKKFGSIELGIPSYMMYKGVPISSLTKKTDSIRTRDNKKSIKLIPDTDGKLEIIKKGTRDEDGALEFGTAEVEIPATVVKRKRLVKTLTDKSKQPTRRKGVQSIRLRGIDDELGKVRIMNKGQEVAIVERILKKLEEAPIPKKDISALKAKFQMAFKRLGFKKAVEQMRDVAKKYAEKTKDNVDDKDVEEYLKKMFRVYYGNSVQSRFTGWEWKDKYDRISEYLTKKKMDGTRDGMTRKIQLYLDRSDLGGRNFEEVLRKFKGPTTTPKQFKEHLDNVIDDINKEANKILDNTDEEKVRDSKMNNFKEYQKRDSDFFDEQQKYRRNYEALKKAVDNADKIGDVLRAINNFYPNPKYGKKQIANVVGNMNLYRKGSGKLAKNIVRDIKLVFDNFYMDNYTDELDAYFTKGQKELDRLLKNGESKERILDFLNKDDSLKQYSLDQIDAFDEEFVNSKYDILTVLIPRSQLRK